MLNSKVRDRIGMRVEHPFLLSMRMTISQTLQMILMQYHAGKILIYQTAEVSRSVSPRDVCSQVAWIGVIFFTQVSRSLLAHFFCISVFPSFIAAISNEIATSHTTHLISPSISAMSHEAQPMSHEAQHDVVSTTSS